MAKELHVDLVAADRQVWSGQAHLVVAKTTEGEIGIMADHEPVLALLQPGIVTIRAADGDDFTAAVSGGYVAVADNVVEVLAESVQLGGEVDVSGARSDLAQAREEASVTAQRWAEARLRVAEGHLAGSRRR